MRVAQRVVWGLVGAWLSAALLAGCGGSSTAPSSGGGGGTGGGSGGGSGGGGGTSTTTITISNNAVSPKNITVPQGTQVTFINNDTRVHDMHSDPHPEHTDCPEIESVGFLNPGQSRQTANLNTVRVCGYHDHNQNTVTSLQGTITITAR